MGSLLGVDTNHVLHAFSHHGLMPWSRWHGTHHLWWHGAHQLRWHGSTTRTCVCPRHTTSLSWRRQVASLVSMAPGALPGITGRRVLPSRRREKVASLVSMAEGDFLPRVAPFQWLMPSSGAYLEVNNFWLIPSTPGREGMPSSGCSLEVNDRSLMPSPGSYLEVHGRGRVPSSGCSLEVNNFSLIPSTPRERRLLPSSASYLEVNTFWSMPSTPGPRRDAFIWLRP